MNGTEVRRFVIPPDLAGARLDVALARLAPDLSRSRVQRLVEEGRVRLGGRGARASARVRPGDPVEIEVPPPAPHEIVPQELPLAILHEDRDLVVLDKAAGMVVHPARGTPDSTVVNALLFRLRAQAGSAGAGAGARPAEPQGEAPLPRLGLVHRLDKDTSGCLVVARNEETLQALQRQWRAGTVEKTYLAICHGALPPEGRLDTPYGRHPRDRTRFTGRAKGAARRAVTEWRTLETFGEAASLAEVRLRTGRTHQIRVHLSEAGHPLLADAVYGGTRREARRPDSLAARAAAAIGRQALHAARLAFDHPRTGRRVRFEAPLPADFRRALGVLRAG